MALSTMSSLFLKHLSGWYLRHRPGQPIPMSGHSSCGETLPNVQRKPPLAHLKTVPWLTTGQKRSTPRRGYNHLSRRTTDTGVLVWQAHSGLYYTFIGNGRALGAALPAAAARGRRTPRSVPAVQPRPRLWRCPGACAGPGPGRIRRGSPGPGPFWGGARGRVQARPGPALGLAVAARAARVGCAGGVCAPPCPVRWRP